MKLKERPQMNLSESGDRLYQLLKGLFISAGGFTISEIELYNELITSAIKFVSLAIAITTLWLYIRKLLRDMELHD